ncbi:MAG TPA: O-antigen ligase family protein, partial [Thermoanaerobaculia bacterium]|nr:O-antigen ligase family protein [Thermoanaerobaculia bacterium]
AAALAAVCLVALVAAVEWGGPRVRRVAVLVVVVVALALGPRAIEIARGRDPSAAARLVYLEAGMRGIAERPWLGWGPGATPWTLGPHLQPIPGTNPPGEAVGDLHSLPIEVAYELGLLGALAALGVAMAFAVARLREDRAAPDPVRRAGLLGLLGAAVTALASGAWAVSALPVAAAISAGAALSGGSREPGRIENAVARAGALVILLFLAPLDLAERSYERALGVVREASIAALDRAIAFDPAFALYRARRAAYRARPTAFDAADARKAAEDAGSTAPFGLLAGALSAEARSPDSGRLLDSACASARLDGIAPFLRLRATPPPIDPVSVAARALLAEPRLAAAVWWRGREGLLARAVARISALDGVELGWRQSFVDAASSLPDRAGPGALLAYGQESEAASFSLHLLRRRPWGSYLGAVPLSERALAHLGLPSAASLPTTSAALFAGPGCGLGDPPARPKS